LLADVIIARPHQLTELIVHIFICQSNVKLINVMCVANKNEEENYFKRILSLPFYILNSIISYGFYQWKFLSTDLARIDLSSPSCPSLHSIGPQYPVGVERSADPWG